MTHRCHAHGCETPCQPRMLFCLRHWRMTPKPIQSAVWQTYRLSDWPDEELDPVRRAAAPFKALLDEAHAGDRQEVMPW